jgi:ferredoxin
MRDLRELTRESYREVKNLPDVIAERCVHVLIETATCQACVDTCPRDAWVLDDEQLGIDTERCDGCKLCVAACPQGAIQAQMTPALKSEGAQTMALYACELTGIKTDEGIVPCLHALGLNAIMLLYRRGVRTIVGCSSNCSDCIRADTTSLSERVEHFNTLLQDRKLPAMQYRKVTEKKWSRLLSSQLQDARGPSMNRRQFFRRMTHAVIEENKRLCTSGHGYDAEFIPPGKILPSQSPAQIVPFLPQIDPGRCNGCDACAKLCPHGAISSQTDEQAGDIAYQIAPEECSGCGICTDVCELHAVSIKPWAAPGVTRIPLSSNRCRACGAPFHVPSGNASAAQLCRICAQTNHHRLLFQIMGKD